MEKIEETKAVKTKRDKKQTGKLSLILLITSISNKNLNIKIKQINIFGLISINELWTTNGSKTIKRINESIKDSNFI